MTDAVRLPPQLQHPEFRFCLIQQKEKRPFEKGWPDTANYTYDDKRLAEHLERGGNYGVLGGYGGLVQIDSDSPEVEEAVREDLPPTFVVRTGRGGKHFYFLCRDLKEPIRLFKPGSDVKGDIGDVSSFGKQVVGPGSIHPNGKRYEVIEDRPIAEVKAEQIRFALRKFIKDESEATAEVTRTEAGKVGAVIDKLNIADVVNLATLKRHGDEYRGPHPVHGSEGGKNFSVNVNKNVWKCFRHDTGGGPLEWIAVENRILDCAECLPGALRDDKFKQALKIAADKYGLEMPRKKGRKKEKDEERFEFNVKEWAEKIMEQHHIVTLRDNDEMLIYNGGSYEYNAEAVISETLERLLDEEFSRYRDNEVTHYIKAGTYVGRDLFKVDARYINLANGVYDLVNGRLLEHSPDHHFLHQLPVEYDPDADCPKIKKFLSEVLDPSDIPLIFEVIGYCLYRSYPIQKAIMFIGDGANGKSTLIALIKHFLGERNVAQVALQDLEKNRFSAVNLYGKLANLYPDLPDEVLKRTGKFKMLTGGDTLMVERKFQGSFSMKNHAKLIFSCNQLPPANDETDAFFRRWVLINFPNTFPPDRADPYLLQKLVTKEELSGLLNEALQALVRIIRNGAFSYTQSTEELRAEYIRKSDPVHAFVLDMVIVDPEGEVPKDEVFYQYTQYCKRNKLPLTDKSVFSKKLGGLVRIEATRPSVGGERVRCWKGIRLSIAPEYEDSEEKRPTGIEEYDDGGEAEEESAKKAVDSAKNGEKPVHPRFFTLDRAKSLTALGPGSRPRGWTDSGMPFSPGCPPFFPNLKSMWNNSKGKGEDSKGETFTEGEKQALLIRGCRSRVDTPDQAPAKKAVKVAEGRKMTEEELLEEVRKRVEQLYRMTTAIGEGSPTDTEVGCEIEDLFDDDLEGAIGWLKRACENNWLPWTVTVDGKVVK